MLPELWLFALGGLFVAVTLLLPRGIVGTFRQAVEAFRSRSARRARKAPAAAAPAPVAAPRPAE